MANDAAGDSKGTASLISSQVGPADLPSWQEEAQQEEQEVGAKDANRSRGDKRA